MEVVVADQSHLDGRYFIDESKYNCPFCNRRHVSYNIQSRYVFNWTDSKTCRVVFVRCGSCEKVSMHLSFQEVLSSPDSYWFKKDFDIDAAIFLSVPSSFHVVDARIPATLRELLAEAEGCLKSNFLTGASACARKLVYELAKKCGAVGSEYDDRIRSLKEKLPGVDPSYFDTLLTIQQVTSDKVHENAYDGWESKHLRLIISTLHEVLQEVFVLPAIRAEKRKAILDVKNEVLGDKDLRSS
jgi:transcription elongation factor Elf1